MTGTAPTENTPGSTAPGSTAPGSTAPAYAVAPKTNTLAIVSFVSAFVVSLVAIITGHIALAQIRARGEAGRGLALAGLILGYIGAALVTVAVILAIVFAATLAAFLTTYSVGSDDVAPSASPTQAPGLVVPQGQLGSAYFDEGYLEVGTGPVVIDQFFDPLCPYCKDFDDANGQQLALAVDNDAITLRLHSLTFLDRASNGTAYSTRASAALTCEAAINPDTTLDFLAALYANQPAEGTSGLTDTELIGLSTGSASIEECVTSGQYQLWSQLNTEAAFAGDDAGLPAITGTPSVFVDGVQYLGAIDDPAQFSEFVAGAF
ncbi:DUF4190 domain-containing protein [Cryobacterium frigoriphilum]|uniref:DUF4190 domain-containing protein n=1 Tax=Cryobacterium frigoriphilum TaxID=1259150 RepID=A0A4R8ZV20_9MICO|nr:DUF4190 domain-containing protein [Cryobacterium frigoriphilum]TFD47090.1 DUF4190 domain-containing protein [Cryobacterium frigoriphilum]